MKTTAQTQVTKFSNGVYNPREARDLVSSVIDGQINFYKLQHLMKWEADHAASAEDRDKKIDELVAKKNELKDLFNTANQDGYNISLDWMFEMKLVK